MKNIPVLHVQGKTLADAYEKALIELYNNGCRFKTQYDKPEDPESIDCTMNITIDSPMSDPMIHKAFPGGIGDLKEYVMELQGNKDHWVKNLDDPEDTRWEYTYYGRFRNWGQWKVRGEGQREDANLGVYNKHEEDWENVAPVDQIEAVIQKLIKQPFTRQAQMVTWTPNLDLGVFDPPCLQSIWCRMTEEDGIYYLNYNMRIRSNDAWGAYFMNSFGLTMFVKELIADEISKRTGKEVKLARFNWHADSWHIYGKDIQQAKERLFNRLDNTKFENRIYNFYDPDIQEMYNEAEEVVKKKIIDFDAQKAFK